MMACGVSLTIGEGLHKHEINLQIPLATTKILKMRSLWEERLTPALIPGGNGDFSR
jgi:hypothetical protein